MLDGLLWIWRTSSKSNSNEKKHTQIHGFMLVEYAKYICNMSHNFYHFTILIHNTLIYHVLPHWRNPAIWGLIKNFLWFFFLFWKILRIGMCCVFIKRLQGCKIVSSCSDMLFECSFFCFSSTQLRTFDLQNERKFIETKWNENVSLYTQNNKQKHVQSCVLSFVEYNWN